MTQRLWNKAVLALSILCIMGVFLVNVFIDPANIFSHSHSLNRWKSGFDERLQKTSYLTHRADIDAIDTVMFGSSRNTYYDQENFEGMSVFNYAVSNGNPEEYNTFLSYARYLKGAEFENIIIGLDFVGYGFEDRNAGSNALLMDDIKGSFFWMKYLSLDMLVNSMKTVVSSVHTKLGTRVYDKNNNTYISRVDPDTTIATAKRRSGLYYSNMVFDDGYFDALRRIKATNPNTNFIVFTNPVSTPFLNAIYTDPALKGRYFQWARKTVDVFGDVYFFTYPNEFAKNYMTASKDGDHYYKETLQIITDILQNKADIAPYGLHLTSERLDMQMDDLRMRVQNSEH